MDCINLPSTHSARLLVRLRQADVAMFRFLLEAHDNLAYFTVLERKPPLLKVVFAPQSCKTALDALEDIGQTVPIQIEEWP